MAMTYRSMWEDFLVITGMSPSGRPKKRITVPHSRQGYPRHCLKLRSDKERDQDKKDAELLRSKY